ncbi:SgcJ/EcaC family oxidoreductase [Sphaerisporangium sp. NPDC049002]|uniref:SgcJ/EcaC family oxidoreductase n=1 Tax=Sphaerisporangium sp. NPDC049002 TaxID=3155392 RepID=UPI003406E743
MGIHRYARRTIHLALAGGLGMALTAAATPTQAVTPVSRALSAQAGSEVSGTGPYDTELAALARLWQRQADAWAHGNGMAYAATYTTDADFVNVTGDHLRTRNEIGTKFQRYLGNQLKNSRIHTLEEKIHLLSPSTAFIIRKGCVFFGSERTCHPNTLSWNTSIAVKQSGQWLIRSFHNTLVRH